MQKLHRKPEVSNKYELTIKDIKKLKVGNRSLLCEPLFWRNNVINACCISGSSGTAADHRFGTDDGYWIGIYEDSVKTKTNNQLVIIQLYTKSKEKTTYF